MSYSKIRFIREIRKYSQDYISKKLGIPQNTYSTWEENPHKINKSYLEKIAVLLNVSQEDLVSEMPFIINLNAHVRSEYINAEQFTDNNQYVLEKLIQTLEAQIKLLIDQNNFLKKENEKLQKMLQLKKLK